MNSFFSIISIKSDIESMKKLLYPLAIIVVITLAFGYFGFQAGNLAQAILVTAIITVLSAFIFQVKPKKAK